jgi:hypothetical protein
MLGRSAAALMKKAQTLASKGDDSMIELAEVICDLRSLPKPPDHAVRGHQGCLDPPWGRGSVPEDPVASDLTQPKASIDGAPPERSGSSGASSSCPPHRLAHPPSTMSHAAAPSPAQGRAIRQRSRRSGCQGGCDSSIDSASALHCEVQGRASVRLCAVHRHPFGRPHPISRDTSKSEEVTHFRVESARMRCV